MSFQLKSRMLFCDWHMPDFLPELTIDYDAYFEGVTRTGAESLIFMGKTAHGICLFPSEVGVTSRTMRGDIFGEIATRAKASGLEFIAYYNMVLSWELPKIHPEWSQLGRDGEPLRMFLYPCSCMSWDGFRDYVAEHMAEIARNYPIDGFFLDLQYFSPHGCYCDACRAKFSDRFGYPLEPEGWGVPQWLDLLAYQIDTREAFIHAAQARCNQERPNLSWSWNGCGSPASISATLPDGADYLSTEAHPPEYLHADYATRFCESFGRPFTLFMPESQGSWGDWTITTAPTMKALSGLALSHGGSLNINHVPYPCGDRAGQVPEVVWDTIGETFDWVAERAPFGQGTRPVPVVAALRSMTNARLLNAMSRAGVPGSWGGGTHGNENTLAQLLCETHTQWEIRQEDVPAEELARYELVILPYLPYVPDELGDKLRAYVRAGGNLLATYHTSLYGARGEQLENFSLADLFGVDFADVSPYSISYLDGLDDRLRPGVPDMPLLLKDVASGRMNPANHALYCRPHESAEVLGWLMDPAVESDFEGGRYVYHDHSPPGTRTEHPAIVHHRVGDGRVIYLPPPYLQGYAAKKCPYLKQVFRLLLNDILDLPRRLRIEAPPSTRASLREDGEGWLLHLVQVQKETDSIYIAPNAQPNPVRVTVKPDWPIAGVEDCLTGDELAVTDGTFVVPGVMDHGVVRVRRR